MKDLTVKLKPGVNYFIAPNGHGKSSILMAMVLALGSDWRYLKQLHAEHQLISTGQKEGFVEIMFTTVELADDIMSAKSRVSSGLRVLRVTLTENAMKYHLDGKLSSRADIVKLVQKHQIFVDNPFMSMMQLEAQKIMSEPPEKKLKYVLQLISPEIEAQFGLIDALKDDARHRDPLKSVRSCLQTIQTTAQQFRVGVNNSEQLKEIVQLRQDRTKVSQFAVVVQANVSAQLLN